MLILSIFTHSIRASISTKILKILKNDVMRRKIEKMENKRDSLRIEKEINDLTSMVDDELFTPYKKNN